MQDSDSIEALWPDYQAPDLDGAALLNDVFEFTGRFVAYPSEHAHVAHVLWIAHVHLMDCWDSTPRLAALSPEKECGKSRLLEVTEPLVPRPVQSVNVTPAYLFRKVGDPAGRPTILYDEIDTIFGPKARDNEEVRGLLNAGHRRHSTAGRCVMRGKLVETEELPAYCAVALAGIGNLPDTITGRSIILRMRRRAPTEQVQPWRERVYREEAALLHVRLVEWALGAQERLQGFYPKLPEGIVDRAADMWEPLIAVADDAGGDWPELAREACVFLVNESRDSTPSLGVRLLKDLKEVFGDQSSMATRDIINGLVDMDEAPWASLRGRPLDARGLANLLKPYDVHSRTLRTATGTAKGYYRDDLWDAWQRYLPSETNVPSDERSQPFWKPGVEHG